MINVIVDTLGGDKGPVVNIEAAVKAVNSISDLTVLLCGDKTEIEKQLLCYDFDKNRVEVIHAPDVISCNDKPTEAIKHKTESSLYRSFELLRTRDDVGALVSTGSTGAILVGAVLRLGRIRGVKRPAFCPILPTVNGKITAICDSGANAECTPDMLEQFALMGSLYLEKAFGVKNPKVALLNIGVEEEKGDTLRKEVYSRLSNNDKVNFGGNMEARELLGGEYDLVVCDGFSGNVLLKSTEGACLELLTLLKGTFYKNLKNKIGALLVKKDVTEIKNLLDYNKYGGAVLLGAKKTIVKGHGSSKTESVFHCIEQAYNMEKSGLREAIAQNISLVQE